MNLLPVLLALLPVVVILLLLVLRRTAADVAGCVGWVVAMGVAWLYFQTPLPVALRASLGGIVASLPIALVVATSILQVTIMLETGAIARVVALIKSVAPGDQVVQIMLINVGFGTLLTALGAVPVSILPPIMLALGYSSFAAIALPAIGYDALCTYALLEGLAGACGADEGGRLASELAWRAPSWVAQMPWLLALQEVSDVP
jgi:lactate permease